MKVKDLIESSPIVVASNCSVQSLCEKLDQSELKTAVVIDDDAVVGLVSLHDVLANVVPYHLRMDPILAEAMVEGYFMRNYEKVKDQLVGDIMKREVDFLKPEDTVIKAVTWFVEKKRRALPVLDEEGKFFGMITRVAVLKMMMAGEA